MRGKRPRHSAEETRQFGFRWDQLDVVRNMEYRGLKSLSVITDHGYIEIGTRHADDQVIAQDGEIT